MKAKNVLEMGSKFQIGTDNRNPAGITTLLTGPKRHDLVTQASVRGNYLAPNSYRGDTMLLGYPTGKLVWNQRYANGNWTNVEQSGCVAFSSKVFWDLPGLDDQLYNTALNRLNEQTRGTLDLTLALSQAGSTARMMHATRRAEDFVLKTKESKWRAINKGISSAWLEFVYGWAPLAQDIYDAATEATYVATGNTAFEGSARKRLSGIGTIGFDFQYYGRASAPIVGTHQQLAKIAIVLSNDDSSFARWGSVNPGSVTWENIPYSFVVDWVYDVSSYLRAMETAMLYSNKFRSGYVVRSYVTDGKYQIKAARSESGIAVHRYSVEASGYFKTTHHSRAVLGSYPLARLPQFNTELSVSRLFNLAALLAARIKRKVIPK